MPQRCYGSFRLQVRPGVVTTLPIGTGVDAAFDPASGDALAATSNADGKPTIIHHDA